MLDDRLSDLFALYGQETRTRSGSRTRRFEVYLRALRLSRLPDSTLAQAVALIIGSGDSRYLPPPTSIVQRAFEIERRRRTGPRLGKYQRDILKDPDYLARYGPSGALRHQPYRPGDIPGDGSGRTS